MKEISRKFSIEDHVIIHHSFLKKCNGVSGKIFSFVNINGYYYYDLKLTDGQYILSVLEANLMLADKR